MGARGSAVYVIATDYLPNSSALAPVVIPSWVVGHTSDPMSITYEGLARWAAATKSQYAQYSAPAPSLKRISKVLFIILDSQHLTY